MPESEMTPDARDHLGRRIRLTDAQLQNLRVLVEHTGHGVWAPSVNTFGKDIDPRVCASLVRLGLARSQKYSEHIRGERRATWTVFQITDSGRSYFLNAKVEAGAPL